MIEQHKKFSDYRDLTQEEINLMNRIKAFGPELEKLCADLEEYHQHQQRKLENSITPNLEEYRRIMDAAPHYWRNEGMRHLQQGLMFLTRSVTQPTFF